MSVFSSTNTRHKQCVCEFHLQASKFYWVGIRCSIKLRSYFYVSYMWLDIDESHYFVILLIIIIMGVILHTITLFH